MHCLLYFKIQNFFLYFWDKELQLFKSFQQTQAKVNTEQWGKGSTHPCTSPGNDCPSSVFAQLRPSLWNDGESKWQSASVNSSSSGKLGTDTDAAHGCAFIAECLLYANDKHKLQMSSCGRFYRQGKKYKKIFLKVPCELGWKLHAKLTSYIFMLHRQFLMQVLVWLYRKTDGDGDEKLISLFPLRPTLLHPLGVRAMFCKFQADETPALSPVTSKEAMK